MKVELLENTGNVSLLNQIDKSFSRSKEMEIASAFITSWSVRQLREYLESGSKNIRLLIGLFGRFNKQKDLKSLLELQNEFAGKFQVRISKNPKFHWKYYFFHSKSIYTTYIGSANFTREGLDKEGELMIRVTSNSLRGLCGDSSRSFIKLWEQSIKIEEFPIAHYREIKRPPKEDINNPTDDTLKKLLSNPSFISNKKTSNSGNIQLRYIRVKDNISKKTEIIIDKYHSTWNKSNYNFICFPYIGDFKVAAASEFLLHQFWENGKWYFNIERVLDYDSSLETPDGKYFVAFKKENTRSKTVSRELDELLQACKIKFNSRNYSDKTLGAKQTKLLLKFFNIRTNIESDNQNSFYLPAKENRITPLDKRNGIIRITVDKKKYFNRQKQKLEIVILNKSFPANYSAIENGSDVLRIGKEAMNLLAIKNGEHIKFTKSNSSKFLIEKE
jgi:HKD family nuclease